MRIRISRVKSIGFFLWHGRHELYHVVLGIFWIFILQRYWIIGDFKLLWVSVIASLLPDADHILYLLTYGRKEQYAVSLKVFIRDRQWRNLWLFMEKGHKKNTALATHNYLFTSLCLGATILSIIEKWETTTVLFGSMFFHYLFDIADDVMVLGKINDNWKRVRRIKGVRNDAHLHS